MRYLVTVSKRLSCSFRYKGAVGFFPFLVHQKTGPPKSDSMAADLRNRVKATIFDKDTTKLSFLLHNHSLISHL